METFKCLGLTQQQQQQRQIRTLESVVSCFALTQPADEVMKFSPDTEQQPFGHMELLTVVTELGLGGGLIQRQVLKAWAREETTTT